MRSASNVDGRLGYLPDETPPIGKLLLFALQQVLVMFPATVTVALLTGFHVSTTLFASGAATLCFLLITRGKIPLYYGSSFSYIAAIVGITGASQFGHVVADSLISEAQFGIICSGVVSIVAGIIVSFFGMKSIEKVLPASVTGSIALVIGLSLAGTALTSAAGYSTSSLGEVGGAIYSRSSLGDASNNMWIAAIVTLLVTIIFSVYLKGVWGQIPILLGIIVGYAVSVPLGLVDFTGVFSNGLFAAPHFTLPKVSASAAFAVMPIAIATIPESTAHLFQLHIYVNDLSKKKGKDEYQISDKLGLNLIGDGVGDMVASVFGGPGGTNYGENISTMAITRNFSVVMLATAAVISIALSFITPLINIINTVPSAVINGACIFLFGVIGAQGIAIMIEKHVDIFDTRNLSIIAVILIIGIGGSFGFAGGMIPFFGLRLPAIATAAIVGIVLNLILSIGRKGEAR